VADEVTPSKITYWLCNGKFGDIFAVEKLEDSTIESKTPIKNC
jgi:hypothetical protein